ncbi:hypothetical protein Rcae01_00295 [Novipirellula caenicola]|uniref:Uncharacterized protein n=1 Tax=Novipirellula caenicola TaxID=1536901 RepID=A0ABP9VI17_9BACT
MQGGGKIDSVLRNATLLLVAVGVGDDLCCGATATGMESAPQDRLASVSLPNRVNAKALERKYPKAVRVDVAVLQAEIHQHVSPRLFRHRFAACGNRHLHDPRVAWSRGVRGWEIEKVELTIENFKMDEADDLTRVGRKTLNRRKGR